MFRTLFALILAVSLAPMATFAAPAVVEVNSANLRELLENKNPEVEASLRETEAASERTGSWRRSFLPTIEADAGSENFSAAGQPRKTQPVYGAEASLNLYNGGIDRTEGRIRDLELEKLKARGKRVLADELEKARALYWQLRFLQEKTALLNETLKINEGNLGRANRRIKSGVSTEIDRIEFEMKAVDLKRELAETELATLRARRDLLLSLGLPDETELRFNEKLAHDHDFEKSLEFSAKDHEFMSKENELSAEQLLLERGKAARAWLPRLDAYAQYRQNTEREREYPDADDRIDSVVGLRLSLNLGGAVEANREKAAKELESTAARLRAERTRREVATQLRGERDELNLLHSQVHDAEENIRRAESYERLTQSEYSRGVKNSPDVLNAAEKIFDMRNKRLEIIRDFQIAKSHVLSKLGR